MNLDRVDPEEVGMNSGRLAGIRQVMQSYVDSGKITGLSTLLARKGKVVHFEQVGVMDRESAVPLADDAIFRIYSMTKSITCTALMTLYEKGCFQLDDPVSKYLPAFDRMKVLETGLQGNNTQVDPAIPITILHLLTHTAGLTYDFLEDSPVCEMYREARLFNRADRSLEELVSELYMAETESSNTDKLWRKVQQAMEKLNIPDAIIEHIMEKKSVEILAKNLQEWLNKSK